MKRLATRLAHSACTVDPATGAVVAPIHLATTFERATDGSYPLGFSYSRSGNPTRHLFEKTLADLEGGAACAAFGSGMAASATVLQALQPGDHVILPDDVYHGVRHSAYTIFEDWGLTFSSVDLTNPGNPDQYLLPNTRLVWIETPSNPLLRVTDVQAISERAHAAGARVAVDATWNTPLLMRPFEWGADLVIHSVTKYLAGHSDVLGGAVVTKTEDDFFERIRAIHETNGAVMDPFGAWLALRGMRSLHARMRLHCENAGQIAAFLDAHAGIDIVHYPGLASHPGHAIASQQMDAFGGMISFEVPGGREAAMQFTNRLRLIRRATSLGGTESLIEHRASIEPQPTATPEGLLRLSVGLEHPQDLLADLDQALTA